VAGRLSGTISRGNQAPAATARAGLVQVKRAQAQSRARLGGFELGKMGIAGLEKSSAQGWQYESPHLGHGEMIVDDQRYAIGAGGV